MFFENLSKVIVYKYCDLPVMPSVLCCQAWRLDPVPWNLGSWNTWLKPSTLFSTDVLRSLVETPNLSLVSFSRLKYSPSFLFSLSWLSDIMGKPIK